MATTFKRGDVVKTKKGVYSPRYSGIPHHMTAKIEHFLTDCSGGVRLDRHLRGFRYWNVDCLELVKDE